MSPRPPPPQSCDTFVVLSDRTKGGHVIFGKNSDRLQEEVQEVIYRKQAKHEDGSKVQVSRVRLNFLAEGNVRFYYSSYKGKAQIKVLLQPLTKVVYLM